MKKIRVYFDKHNASDQAEVDRLRDLDWFDVVEFTTDEPPEVKVRHKGWLVQVIQTGKMYQGTKAKRMIFFRLPSRIPLALLMFIPFLGGYIAKSRSRRRRHEHSTPDTASTSTTSPELGSKSYA